VAPPRRWYAGQYAVPGPALNHADSRRAQPARTGPRCRARAAYLRLVSRRAALAMSAARTALASDSDAGAIRAARDLFGAVADEPATGYQPATPDAGGNGKRVPGGAR
jgi:hypothetical protein